MSESQFESGVEATVIKHLGVKPLREIAELTGLTPEKILAIRNEFFEGVDALTVDQKIVKALISLDEIAQAAKKDAENAGERNKAGLWNASTAAIKTGLTELRKYQMANDSKVEILNSLRVKELISLIQEAVNTSIPELSERYEIPEDDMFAVFNANLAKAAMRREIE